jgi:hypothetical protein
MNMRNNMVLVVGGGGGAVLLLLALVYLFNANAVYQKKGKRLEQQYRRLHELNVRSPFPSMENAEQMEQNLDRLDYHVGELAAQLVQDPFPPDAVESADFSARAQEVIERFRKRAANAGIVLPEGLEAGFSQYASGGAVPEPAHVPRLSRQLYSMEKVADILIRSEVRSIESLTRDVFEAPDAAAAMPSTRRRARRSGPPPGEREDIRTVASAVHPDGFYYVEHVGATVTADELSVWRLLDLLASVPHLMVLSDFRHATQTDILSYNPEAAKQAGKGDDETQKFLAGGILSGEQALSRPERIVAGNEIIRVSIRVDVYNFEPAMGKDAAR